MITKKSLPIILFLLTVVCPNLLTKYVLAACTTDEVDRDMKLFYKTAVSASLTDSNLQAGLLRAGFHDCVSTTTEKPASGCNGSLRSESERSARNNARLGPTIDYVVTTRDSIASCISYADAFILGYCAATKTAAGLSIVRLMVDPSSPRTDALNGVDDIHSSGRVLLPNPTADFETNLQFYTDRGMNAIDLVVSNVVGHAIGSVRSRLTNPVFSLNNFTASPNIVGPQYAAHLLWRHDQDEDIDLKGFNTLPSDVSFEENDNGRSILEGYASYRIIGGKGNPKIRLSWTGAQAKQVLVDYQRFSVKLSQLSGRIMTGDASFSLPSDVGVLRRSTKDWDGPRDEIQTGSKRDIEENPQLSDTPDGEKPWFKVSKTFFATEYSKVD